MSNIHSLVEGGLTGYLHPGYPASFEEFARPRELPCCGGWVLERPIAGFEDRDAMGCYPLFVCSDWSYLYQDLGEIGDGLVCLSLVTDPFGDYDEAYLHRCFHDVVIPFKHHYVVDYKVWKDRKFDADTRREIRNALKSLKVEVCPDPHLYLDEWIRLYALLIERYHIDSLRAFSRQSFARQFDVPGFWMYRAYQQDRTVGIALAYTQGEMAYLHLTSMDQAGYKLGASYGLYSTAIEHLAGMASLLNIGGTPGVAEGQQDGLKYFKMHWATGTRMTYFCGRIFNPDRYHAIAKARELVGGNYFPSYRKGEFG
jgi:Acetyltransferase (GNAT) domain